MRCWTCKYFAFRDYDTHEEQGWGYCQNHKSDCFTQKMFEHSTCDNYESKNIKK